MAEPAMVDVRDMLCAQALAQVARAAAQLPERGVLDIRYNTEDVRRDLLAWAADRGHALAAAANGHLRLTRGGPAEQP